MKFEAAGPVGPPVEEVKDLSQICKAKKSWKVKYNILSWKVKYNILSNFNNRQNRKIKWQEIKRLDGVDIIHSITNIYVLCMRFMAFIMIKEWPARNIYFEDNNNLKLQVSTSILEMLSNNRMCSVTINMTYSSSESEMLNYRKESWKLLMDISLT